MFCQGGCCAGLLVQVTGLGQAFLGPQTGRNPGIRTQIIDDCTTSVDKLFRHLLTPVFSSHWQKIKCVLLVVEWETSSAIRYVGSQEYHKVNMFFREGFIDYPVSHKLFDPGVLQIYTIYTVSLFQNNAMGQPIKASKGRYV